MKAKRPPKPLGVLLAGLVLAYPVLVYWGRERLGTRWLGGLALAVVTLHCWNGVTHAEDRPIGGFLLRLLPLAALWLAATISGDERMLMLVPALGSMVMGVLFARSLQTGRESWIERLARLSRGFPFLPPTAIRHCRRITSMWAVFLFANGLVCGSLALWGPIGWWTLYAGCLAYVLVGVLGGGEYLYRIARVKPIADREAIELGLLPRENS